mgnify:CR=1 FL=1
MKQTLQEQYQLIKKGKGHKDIFLKESKSTFPEYVRNAATFDEASKILKERGVISENIVSIEAINSFSSPKEDFEDAFTTFLKEAKAKTIDPETVKAETTKPVESPNVFDREDMKNMDQG